MPAMAGAGAVRSTLRDMMRFLDFELGKIEVPLASLQTMMRQPYHAAGPDSSVGLGWHMRDRPDGTKVIFKDGAMPGYSAFIIFAPSSRAGAVVLANQAGCPVGKIAKQLMDGLNPSGANPGSDLPPSEEED
jgi:CubicO group peptidase (beta-lactamase class C family)